LRPLRILLLFGLVAAALVLAIGFQPRSTPASLERAAACPGKWRWPVKTLSDDLASKVNFTAKKTTVATLSTLTKPASLNLQTPRQPGAERRTYRIQAMLVKTKREADGDYHLVIADPGTKERMVVEFPDATCDGAAKSSKREAMAKAREAFNTGCGKPTTKFKSLIGTASVKGVGFFDFLHAGDQAPNGIELHPVLGFTKVVCKKAPPPA
jgi:hypothetical protein